ncbi:MAG: hypothetical protein OXQ90_13290 [Gammaproteobacteria bacterium]|nr:hypothetical protein [Gammaproteobacteria bacterium]
MTTGEATSNNEPTRSARLVLPAWLDGRTIAVLTTVVTAALTLGAMMQTAHSNLAGSIDQVRRDLGNDIDKVRTELSSDIAGLDNRLRSVEVDVAAIRAAMVGFDARLSAVEADARRPIKAVPPS